MSIRCMTRSQAHRLLPASCCWIEWAAWLGGISAQTVHVVLVKRPLLVISAYNFWEFITDIFPSKRVICNKPR